MVAVNLDFKLHEKQMSAFRDESRRVLLVSGRRFGKSMVSLVRTVTKCLTTDAGSYNRLSPPVILVAMPTLVMAKRVLWKPLVGIMETLPKVKINHSEHRIIVPGKPHIVMVGLENYDSVRGLRILHALVDEAQDVSYKVFTEVIFPAMADSPGSTLFCTGTPKGKQNWFYEAAHNPEFNFSFHNYPTSDNPFIPREEIERARQVMPDNIFRQEFLADFVNFEGRILVFDSERDCCSRDSIDTDGVIYIGGVDFGDVNPAYVILAINPVRGVAIVVESKLLGDGKNPVTEDVLYSQLASVSRRFNVKRFFCDPSRPAMIRSMRIYGQSRSIEGMVKAVAAQNKIAPGNNTVNAGFHSGSLKVLYGLPICPKLESYRRVIRDEVYLDKVAEGQDDHEIDALRYAFYTFNVRNRFILTNGLNIIGATVNDD